MKNKRRAILEIDLLDLTQKYDAFDLGEALQSLPEDTVVVSSGVESCYAAMAFVLENPSFKEVSECETYPRVYIREDEETSKLKVDCSSVMDTGPFGPNPYFDTQSMIKLIEDNHGPSLKEAAMKIIQNPFMKPGEVVMLPHGWHPPKVLPPVTHNLTKVQEEINRIYNQIADNMALMGTAVIKVKNDAPLPVSMEVLNPFGDEARSVMDLSQPLPEDRFIGETVKIGDGTAHLTPYGRIVEHNNRLFMSGGTINGCSHDWKSYEGLTEKYDYCTKCDSKRSDG